MMATTDQHGEIIYYNAADVGEAGALVSQFVFWHEIGHFRLGHISGVNGMQSGSQPHVFEHTGNKEADADRFACNYWLRHNSLHGWNVIQSVINYFDNLGNSPGDAEHPAPRDRMYMLRNYANSRPAKITIHNDQLTDEAFVIGILVDDFAMSQEEARATVQKIESSGSFTITQIRGVDVEIIVAERLISGILEKARFFNQHAFRIEGGVR